jgi:sugar O-acyltransferase (sialic acid O-acetyltransferase NeuD family)
MNERSISKLPVIMVGGGGHAKVLISMLLLQHRTVLGFVDLTPDLPSVLGVAQLGDDSAVLMRAPEEIRLVNGVGSIGSTGARREAYERFRDKHYTFDSVIHCSAIMAPDVELGNGVQIMAGAVVQPGSRVGDNSIINTGARVDHDCSIDAQVHIAPGATLCGNVRVGRGSHVGAGATVIQGIELGENTIVGAGAVVLRGVTDGETVVGVPAAVVSKLTPSIR